MTRIKSEKGVITMVTLLTILFMISFLIASYVLISNKVRTQKNMLAETKSIYEPKFTMEEIYNSFSNKDNIIPIYTTEHLLKMGSGQQNVNVNGKYYNFSNDENTIYVLMNDLSFKARDYEQNKVEEINGYYWIPVGNRILKYNNLIDEELSDEEITSNYFKAKFEGKNNIIKVGYKDENNNEYIKTYSASNNYCDEIMTIAKGDFVEYGVAYNDIYYSEYEFTTTNGWRLLDYNYNADTNIYTNVKLISTGVPAGTYNYYADAINNDWWVEEETMQDPNAPSLSKFREVLGGKYYTFYTGNDTYYALQTAAGTYYNFGEINFMQGGWSSYNLGYFNSISIYGQAQDTPTIYDENTMNDTEVKKGNELFKVRKDATIRLITLPEINRILKRTTGADDSVDSLTQISVTQDAIGLFRLNQLKNVTRMKNYDYGTVYYWLASPDPSTGARDNVCYVRADGTIGSMYYDYGNSSGVRPVICISSNIQFTDSNDDGTLEITVIQ